MGLLGDSGLFDEPQNDVLDALSAKPEQTRVALTEGQDMGFGMNFYLSQEGELMITFQEPPAHEVHKYPEIMGNFLYKLTNGMLNESCSQAFTDLLGDCEFTSKVVGQWAANIRKAAEMVVPSGPIVSPGKAFGE